MAQFPEDLQVLVGSGLLVGGVTVLLLNAIIPGDGGLESGMESEPDSPDQL